MSKITPEKERERIRKMKITKRKRREKLGYVNSPATRKKLSIALKGKKYPKDKYPNFGVRGFSKKKLKDMAKKSNETNKKNGTGLYSITKKQRIENTKKALKTCKEKKLGAFFNPKLRREIAKKAIAFQKEKGLGLFNPKIRKKACKKSNETSMKNKVGIFSAKSRAKALKNSHKSNKKNGTGFWNPKYRLMGLKSRRENKPCYYKKIPFDSNAEREIGINIYYQIEKLKEGINVHVMVGRYEYDFFIKKYNLFLEYHPNPNINNETSQQYYNRRRKNLNKNRYKNYALRVLT